MRQFFRSLALALFALMLFSSSLAESFPREMLEQIIASVVRVLPLDSRGSPVGSLGSGTVITPDGYLVTNYHVVSEPRGNSFADAYRYSRIDVSPNARSEPEPRYIAEFVDGSKDLDIAILRIVGDARGNQLPRGTSFTYMPVGDSDDVLITEQLEIFGYPGFSGRSLTASTGIVSGFLAEDGKGGGDKWIKTDAKISPGNSGGAAFNEKGELVGIPTLLFSDSKLAVAEGRLRPVKVILPILQRNRIANIMYGRNGSTTQPQAATPSITIPPTAAKPQTPAPSAQPQSLEAQVESARNLAIQSYDRGDYRTALNIFSQLADPQGGIRDVQSQSYLGVMYANGEGVSQDYTQAYKWYQLAASQGDLNALNNMGLMLALGEGVEEDIDTAIKLFNVAAELGHQGARENLMLVLNALQGVTQTQSLSINPNFEPDPIELSATAGGEVSAASVFGGDCLGFIGRQPNHTISLSRDFSYIRFYINAQADTTLVIEDANSGATACADDSSQNDFNPSMELSLPAGDYNVYVGSYEAQTQTPYSFYISERR
ncbi:MAG: bifunctional trypsin-like peptidase domain-containing/SEL1-like repeat protein [Deinococcales bacterium]